MTVIPYDRHKTDWIIFISAMGNSGCLEQTKTSGRGKAKRLKGNRSSFWANTCHGTSDRCCVFVEFVLFSLFWSKSSRSRWNDSLLRRWLKFDVVVGWVEAVDRHTSVDGDDLAGNVRGGREAEKCHEGWHVRRVSDPPEGYPLENLRFKVNVF